MDAVWRLVDHPGPCFFASKLSRGPWLPSEDQQSTGQPDSAEPANLLEEVRLERLGELCGLPCGVAAVFARSFGRGRACKNCQRSGKKEKKIRPAPAVCGCPFTTSGCRNPTRPLQKCGSGSAAEPVLEHAAAVGEDALVQAPHVQRVDQA